jgi:hypothetical protein
MLALPLKANAGLPGWSSVIAGELPLDIAEILRVECLVTKQVGQVGGKRIPHSFVFHFSDHTRREFKADKLPEVEHFSIALVSPAVEPIGFIPAWYLFVWSILVTHACPRFSRFGKSFKVLRIGSLEEPSSMSRLASGAVVFDGKETMARRSELGSRKQVIGCARRASAVASLCRSVKNQIHKQWPHLPGSFLSPVSVNSPQAEHTKTFFGCLESAARRYPGKRSISSPQLRHFLVFTQRKYFTWASSEPHIRQRVR